MMGHTSGVILCGLHWSYTIEFPWCCDQGSKPLVGLRRSCRRPLKLSSNGCDSPAGNVHWTLELCFVLPGSPFGQAVGVGLKGLMTSPADDGNCQWLQP